LALLRCFGYVKCCGCAPALTNQDTRRLILDGSFCPPPPASVHLRACARRRNFGEASARLVCACTHYLVFKEPTASPPTSRRVPIRPSVREPFNVTASGLACQPLIPWPPAFSFGAPASVRRLGNLTRLPARNAPCQYFSARARNFLRAAPPPGSPPDWPSASEAEGQNTLPRGSCQI
jgi:hypothetical protein